MLAKQSTTPSRKFFAVVFVASLFVIPAFAVTETVVHSFGAARNDGQKPFAGLTQHVGAFYGTTSGGGSHLVGTVFTVKLVNGIWKEKVLYEFTGGSDGDTPQSKVVFDNAGNLYSTTHYGGVGGLGFGTVFKLSPNNGVWNETVIHTFTDTAGGDGSTPSGGLIFDASGNLYGTTSGGGTYKSGTVFKLTPSGNAWTETILYNFAGKPDGAGPVGDLIFDGAGNLYGTTASGGSNANHNTSGDGTAFQLSPNLDGTWTEKVLHSFGAGGDGANPLAGLAADASGNLYGTTLYGGTTPNGGHGTVFQLAFSNGTWAESVISSFTVSGGGNFPQSPLTVGRSGNLYGAANGGSGHNGVIYQLSLANGVWTHQPYYTFPNVASGVHPTGNLLIDGAGNFYGTTVSGGDGCGCQGVVYMVAP